MGTHKWVCDHYTILTYAIAMLSGQQTSNVVRHLQKKHSIKIDKDEDSSDADDEREPLS